jgi:hypothetical protein
MKLWILDLELSYDDLILLISYIMIEIKEFININYGKIKNVIKI